MKLFSSPRFWLLAALLLLPFMASNDSLWLDEGDTAMYVLQPDFHAWCDRLHTDLQADCQMPLALLCSWIAGKIWGTAEWQLRGINLIWGALALIGMYRVGQRLKIPWLPLLLAIQPYFWFYNNEVTLPQFPLFFYWQFGNPHLNSPLVAANQVWMQDGNRG